MPKKKKKTPKLTARDGFSKMGNKVVEQSNRIRSDTGFRLPGLRIPVLLLTGCVALGKCPQLPEPYFLHLSNGDSGTYFTGMLWDDPGCEPSTW